MKKTSILILTLVFFNCSSTKTNVFETQEWINSQNFTINKPNSWRPVKHHEYVGYTPLKESDNFFNNLVSIFQYELKEKSSFNNFVQKQIEQTNKALTIISQEILTDKNQLGDVYIHKLESTWNGNSYKKYTVYFEQNGEYYNYNYSSLKHSYEKHFEEAISILKSIEFK
ncbi:hypothetical protein [uncultured Lacinutrix sp.]|uniref:hypothetical protein n=1 Tax=uncultured Lacinutrix sp. TaxID=574032 RepID=UPI002605D20B|nr:hypothetical protein [uncultured Lacinutrix sp.]